MLKFTVRKGPRRSVFPAVLETRLQKAGLRPAHLLKHQKRIAASRRGKTYEQIYGERAKTERRARAKSIKAVQRAKWSVDAQRKNPNERSNYHQYYIWRRAVLLRDKRTCQRCGSKKGWIEAHHIKAWEAYPRLRFEVSNGITLCRRCHMHTDGRAKCMILIPCLSCRVQYLCCVIS
jgi:5-methylcytosine-specific restriction endonuclease McrA